MKALNTKERNSSIFKFSLIYLLSFGFLAFLFFVVIPVPKTSVSEPVDNVQLLELNNQVQHMYKESDSTLAYLKDMITYLEVAEKSFKHFKTALLVPGAQIEDVTNNRKNVMEEIHTLNRRLKEEYRFMPYEKTKGATEKAESIEIQKKNLRKLHDVMRQELKKSSDNLEIMISYATEFAQLKSGMQIKEDCNPIVFSELKLEKKNLEEKYLLQQQENITLKGERDRLLTAAGNVGAVAQEKSEYEELFKDCSAKKQKMVSFLEEAEKEMDRIIGEIGGPKDTKEKKALKELSDRALRTRQANKN